MYRLDEHQCRNYDLSSRREWLLVNGLGGYAMGTASGANSRRYHGHLVAAVRPPEDRMVLLASVEAFARGEEGELPLSTNQYRGSVHPDGYLTLKEFSASDVVVWRHAGRGMIVTKSLAMPRGANSCIVSYRNDSSRPVGLNLRPLVSHKHYHSNFACTSDYPQGMEVMGERIEICFDGLTLHLAAPGADIRRTEQWYMRLEHLRELERGLDGYDDLYNPAELAWTLAPGDTAVLSASLGEPFELAASSASQSQPQDIVDRLRASAERFVVHPSGRTSIIAGYPWFTDWGRDTMISLSGCCLHSGRWSDAKEILTGHFKAMHQGLIPNRVTESGEREYNTADATLWAVNAAHRVLSSQWDDELAVSCAAAFAEIYDWHMRGAANEIRCDPADGLLWQGNPDTQLTWMDARVDGRPVSSRHGKAVEINGLWASALAVMAWLADRLESPCEEVKELSSLAKTSFEKSFWNEDIGYYLDVCEPRDASLRPNQVLPMALPFPPNDPIHARRALEAVSRSLETPRGLRTLAPDDPRYRGRFSGPLPVLDSSYHMGTAWPWLLGPYCTALSKYAEGGRMRARKLLLAASVMLEEYGLGGIAEVYDGDVPQNPGGCPWQAWSAAEILRAWVEDVGG